MANNPEYIAKWRRDNVTQVQVKIRKDSGIVSALETACKVTGKSRNAYIIDAIRNALQRDGVQVVPGDND